MLQQLAVYLNNVLLNGGVGAGEGAEGSCMFAGAVVLRLLRSLGDTGDGSHKQGPAAGVVICVADQQCN